MHATDDKARGVQSRWCAAPPSGAATPEGPGQLLVALLLREGRGRPLVAVASGGLGEVRPLEDLRADVAEAHEGGRVQHGVALVVYGVQLCEVGPLQDRLADVRQACPRRRVQRCLPGRVPRVQVPGGALLLEELEADVAHALEGGVVQGDVAEELRAGGLLGEGLHELLHLLLRLRRAAEGLHVGVKGLLRGRAEREELAGRDRVAPAVSHSQDAYDCIHLRLERNRVLQHHLCPGPADHVA
eukprot:CAMPEP_0171159378 /NCGR_PEP_ID=MMETSP0790-20130122/3009_1 /TAXON_ID=2925 /ORGANISM="Alexandrium catenella, Strain OF101" /LENGTH=242 /DNA_ID=CAMNT_0011623875 /DNA_START=168 /DNA_END=892 /DNA_ORIENTATION=+